MELRRLARTHVDSTAFLLRAQRVVQTEKVSRITRRSLKYTRMSPRPPSCTQARNAQGAVSAEKLPGGYPGSLVCASRFAISLRSSRAIMRATLRSLE
jgi:hypothetical protein